MDEIRLVLYVADHTPSSTQATRRIRACLAQLQTWGCEVEIIDVIETPERAETARVVATPTLVRVQPLPERRIVGDLSDWARVLAFLGLEELMDRFAGDEDKL